MDIYIQWKLSSEEKWTNLIALDDLKGADGATPVITINTEGYWVINGVPTEYLAVIPREEYSVTFELNGGELPAGASALLENVNGGSTIDLPVPSKEYYKFAGWYTGLGENATKFTVLDTVNDNLVLYAKWDVDYSYVEEFLSILASHNYTVHVKEQYGEFPGEIFDYILKSQNNAEVVMTNIIGFYLVYANFPANISFSTYEDGQEFYQMLYYIDEDYGEFFKLDKEYEFPFDFNIFDVEKFVKRDNAPIYDYDETVNVLLLKEPCAESAYQRYNLKATLDLDSMKLVYSLDILDGNRTTSLFERELEFSDLGSTTVESLLEQTREIIHTILDCEIPYDVIETSTDASIALFSQRLTDMEAMIEDTDDVSALYALTTAFISEINEFKLDSDDFKLLKKSAIEYLECLLEDKPFASDESLAEMEAIYQEFAKLIRNSSNYFEVYAYRDQAADWINNAYVYDSDKKDLHEYKFHTVDGLFYWADFAWSFLDDETDYPCYDIILIYSDLIYEAKDYDEVDRLYELAYEAMVNANARYDENQVNGYREYIIYDFLSFSQYALEFYQTTTEEIETALKAIINKLNSTNSPLLLSKYYNEDWDEFEALITARAKDYFLGRLEISKEEKIALAYDEDIDDIIAAYEAAVDDINICYNIIYISDRYNNFYSFIISLSNDPFKEQIRSSVIELQSYFEYLSLSATEDSIEDMEVALEEGIAYVQAGTDNDDVDTRYNEVMAEIRALYVVDSDKLVVRKYIEEKLYEMGDLSDFLIKLLDDYEDTEKIFDLLEYGYSIYYAQSISEAEEIFEQWYYQFTHTNVTIDYYSFYGMKDDLSDDIYDIYYSLRYEIYNDLSIYKFPLDLEYAYREAYYIVETSYNILDIFYAHRNLINLYVNHTKELMIEEVDEVVNYCLYVLSEEDKEDLMERYEEFRSNLDAYAYNGDLYILLQNIDSFMTDLPDYDVDGVLEQKYYALKGLRDEIDTLKPIATDDSIAAMEGFLADFEDGIDALETESDVIEATNNTVYQIISAFERDEEKYQLIIAKAMYSQMIDSCYYEIYYNTYDFIELYRLYYHAYQDVNSATSVEEIEAIYEAWHTALKEMPYEVYKYVDLEEYKAYLIQDLRNRIYSNLNEDEDISLADQTVKNYISLLESSEDLIDMAFNYSEGATLLYFIIGQMSSELFTEQIDALYDAIINTCEDGFEMMVEISYAALKNIASIFTLVEDYYSYMDNYFMWMVFMPTNNLKSAKYYAIQELQYEFEKLSQTAIAESIIAMQTILDQYKSLINEATDTLTVDSLEYNGIEDLNEAYVGDPELEELIDTRSRMYIIYSRTYYALEQIIPSLQLSEYKYIYILNYHNRFVNAQSVEELNQIYAEWCAEVEAYEFSKDNLESARDNYLDQLITKFEDYEIWSEDIIADFNDYVASITETTNLFVLVRDYVACDRMLEEFLSTH